MPLLLRGSMQTTGGDFAQIRIDVDMSGQTARAGTLNNIGTANGLLSALVPGVVDTTVLVNFSSVPVNTALSLELQIGAQVFVNGSDFTFSNFDTFGFVTDGPAFIVPTGVDVKSAEAGIVNNQFGESNVVPEPATVTIWSTLGLIVAVSRRRRRCNRDRSTVQRRS